jgi:hypothetical protein
LPVKARGDDTMKADDVGDALKKIPVRDVHHLVHAGGGLWIGWRQGRGRRHTVEVAQDRLGFIQQEVIVLQDRHFTERVARQVLRIA